MLYPKKGKGHKWTVKELDSLKYSSNSTENSISDGDGLFGKIRRTSNGISINFEYGFKWEGNKKYFYCGSYPKFSIEEIRINRDRAKQLLKSKINPVTALKSEIIKINNENERLIQENIKRKESELLLLDLYNDWISFVTRKNTKNLQQSFDKHILPFIANIRISALSEKHLFNIYQAIVANGNNRTAQVVEANIRQMLNWAELRQPYRKLLENGNPAKLISVNKMLPHDYQEERTRILSEEELVNLNKSFYNSEKPLKKESQLAIWICLGTLCRIGELLQAEWSHINFERQEWFIPKANVKGNYRTKKEHTIYLSDFVLEKFKALKMITGRSKFCFPAKNKDGHLALNAVSKQIGDRQYKFKNRKELIGRINDNSLVIGDLEWTPHDMRRTGATIMQSLGVLPDIIDRCQNHILPGNKIRKHYQQYIYSKETREAWIKLGTALSKII
jgi:integrase